MIDYCDASNHQTDCRREHLRRKSDRQATGGEGGFRSLRRWGILTAVLLMGGCSWFTDDEPAFPPTAGGPNIATVPEGLGSDTANAEYSDQDLSVQTETAPRPAPPPPPAPKTPEAEAPAAPAPTASIAAPADSSSAPTGSNAPSNSAPANSTPASSTPATLAPSAAGKTDKGGYPDVNSVPMETPVPTPDPDAPAPATPPADPQKSSQAAPPAGNRVAALMRSDDWVITTAAGGSPCAAADQETNLAQAAAVQTNDNDDADVMFSKPSLPPYIPYEEMQKQAQPVGNAPIPLGQSQLGQSQYGQVQSGRPAAIGQVVYSEEPGIGQASGVQAGAQPVGLVYFSDGSTNLSGDDRRILRQIAQLQQTFGGVIRIIGHASSRTENMPMERHSKANIDVSVARAAAVARQLVRLGVNPNFVQVAGVSDSRPVYPEIMPAGEAANRRAEIYLSSN